MERLIQSGISYELRPLEEGPELQLAREWAKKRRVYVHHSFDADPAKKYVGVFVGSRLASVITIEMTGDAEYLFHVTSPKGSDLETVATAVYSVGWQLFDRLGAESIWTHRPTVSGHEHRGSTALCESTGLRPYGLPEEETIDGVHYSWQVYQMTRLDWLTEHQRKAA